LQVADSTRHTVDGVKSSNPVCATSLPLSYSPVKPLVNGTSAGSRYGRDSDASWEHFWAHFSRGMRDVKMEPHACGAARLNYRSSARYGVGTTHRRTRSQPDHRSPPPCQYVGAFGTFRDSGPLRCRGERTRTPSLASGLDLSRSRRQQATSSASSPRTSPSP
jgi:hypothetical protein